VIDLDPAVVRGALAAWQHAERPGVQLVALVLDLDGRHAVLVVPAAAAIDVVRRYVGGEFAIADAGPNALSCVRITTTGVTTARLRRVALSPGGAA